MAARMNVLRIENLRRAFGSLVVTNRVNLDLAGGERHAIIGPNGAGKTSLVNQIGGQLRPSGANLKHSAHRRLLSRPHVGTHQTQSLQSAPQPAALRPSPQ